MKQGIGSQDRLRDTYISKRMMLWLIRNLSVLKDGVYPSGASSYINFPPIVKKGGSQKAPFVNAVEYAIEVEHRLMRAGADGLILLCIECFEITESTLAGYFRTSDEAITRKSQEALGYVSGYSRKRSDYRTHYQHRKASQV